MKKDLVLAIDIGGTNVKSGLVDRQGRIARVLHLPSHAAEGRAALLAVIEKIVRVQCAHGPIAAVGAGSPGTVDHAAGRIAYMQAHIPRWTGTPLAALLARWSGVPATIDNDVNLIALGEHWKGAGKGARVQISLALGTGLGGGIVVNGRLFRGARGRAPEFGHMIVVPGGEPCTCGNFGCAEVYAAPGAMRRRAHQHLDIGMPSALREIKAFHAADILRLAAQGDHLCRKLCDDAVRALAVLVWNLAHAFDPDVIVMGGGMMKAGAPFQALLDAELKKYYCAAQLDPLYTLAVSKLGDNAGILGAAKLAWDWLDGTDRRT